jgi:hypothetical protein
VCDPLVSRMRDSLPPEMLTSRDAEQPTNDQVPPQFLQVLLTDERCGRRFKLRLGSESINTCRPLKHMQKLVGPLLTYPASLPQPKILR